MFNDDPFDQPGGGSLFAQLAQGFSGGGYGPRRQSRQYDEYMKAYSVAMLPGKERTNVSYGGKIIMPPSALASLSNLDLPSPWMFQLRNPQNSAASTHAGVLEFIAEEGCVHLPYWMMKSLRLNEGDPIRITGCELPKGKLVKLQAQSVHFLEISDHKAVLEMALRNFAALTQGDIIEISYNSIVFDLLVMETHPGGGGICVIDTDLEVDFAAPVGYVEPPPKPSAPAPTMAEKLKIDLNGSTPGNSRPGSALSGAFASTGGGNVGGEASVSKGGEKWESFKGRGETLAGRKTKGRGISQKGITSGPAENSRVFKTDKRRIVTADSLDAAASVPAALVLPPNQLFFGFRVQSYTDALDNAHSAAPGTNQASQAQAQSFGGGGHTLSGRSTAMPDRKGKGKAVASSSGDSKEESGSGAGVTWSSGGQTLGSSSGRALGGIRRAPPVSSGVSSSRLGRTNTRTGAGLKKQRERSPTPDFGVDSDDEVIYVDSD